MALAEGGRETDRPSLAILSDDDHLLARVAELARRCGLTDSYGAIAPPRPSPEPPREGTGYAIRTLVLGTLVSGPRAGLEKMFELLAASGEARELRLARAGEEALAGIVSRELRCGQRVLRASRLDRGGRPLVMGILNVTPDSFSDGGRYADPEAAIARGVEMEAQGADIIDVGGESSRPGSEPISLEEESRRVLPVIEALAARVGVPVSIDTTKAEVARRGVGAGATMINDISGMTADLLMSGLVASLRVPVVLNHIRGVPKTMQEIPSYQHVVLEVLLELAVRIRAAREAGVEASRIIVDPGIGFGKRLEDNLALIRHLGVFDALGCPILVGVSRKSFLGAVTGKGPAERFPATLAAEVIAAAAGAEILRTHEPAATRDALKLAGALARSAVSC
jgi:dihydropteroate synthase